MRAISRRRLHHLFDLAFAQKIDRTAIAEPAIAGQHEMHAHPGIIHLKRREHLADAGQQPRLADLESGKDEAVADQTYCETIENGSYDLISDCYRTCRATIHVRAV